LKYNVRRDDSVKRLLFVLVLLTMVLFLNNCGTQVNFYPLIPSLPSPANNSTDISVDTTLSWHCTDPDQDVLVYDIYLGEDSSPPLVKSGHSSNSYKPNTLRYGTKYYWKIVAKDAKGGTSSGPIWSFTTESFSASIYGKVIAYDGDVTKNVSPIDRKVDFSKSAANTEYIPGEYIVQFRSDKMSISSSIVEKSMAPLGSVGDQLRISNKIFYLLRTNLTTQELLKHFSEIPGFVGLSPNYVYRICGEIVPNDPLYSQQWNYPLINLPYTWYLTKGSGIITVAVVDSGIDLSHEDLQGVVSTNGYDFVEDDDQPQDESGHGTHVTGTIAAITNNNKGVAGVTWGNVKILPLKVFGADGSGSVLNVAKAFVYAVDNGAKIINFSGGGGYSDVIYEAVKYAYENDVVIVCAAGNEDGPVIYPAAHSETIAVGAVNSSGQRASYSNYGSELDVVAPGGDESGGVLSTYLNNQYAEAIGTSMATPHVTGVVALMICEGITGVENIRNVLRQTAVDLGVPGFDEYYGAGLVDAYDAVTWSGGWEPLIVYSVGSDDKLDDLTSLQNGNYNLQVNTSPVRVFAWMDFDHDNQLSYGDLYGYYGYMGGNPLKGTAMNVVLMSGENRKIDIMIAPLIDTSNVPVLSSSEMEKLLKFKQKLIEDHYRVLRNK